MYILRKIPLFVKKFYKIIPANKQEDINKRIKKLAINPYVGKPLGFKYIREMKLEKFRVYYIIFEEEIVVMLVTISDKKDQKEAIGFIKNNIGEFKKFIKNLNNR